MSKDVEYVNFTRKSKKQNKADKGAKEIGKGGYFGRKISQDSTQKTCFRCGGGYPDTAQCPAIGKTCNHCHKKNHFERVCRQKFRLNTVHGKSLNHLTVSSPISRSESDSDNEVFTIQMLLLTFLIVKRYLLRKTRQKSHLTNKPTMTNLLLSKLTLTNLFLRTILQH